MRNQRHKMAFKGKAMIHFNPEPTSFKTVSWAAPSYDYMSITQDIYFD